MKTELIEESELPTGSSRTADYQHLFAIAWIAIAWIVGTLVFEVTADGGEFTPADQARVQSLRSCQQEITNAIDFADIVEFDQI